jgi:hypothetical protein
VGILSIVLIVGLLSLKHHYSTKELIMFCFALPFMKGIPPTAQIDNGLTRMLKALRQVA